MSQVIPIRFSIREGIWKKKTGNCVRICNFVNTQGSNPVEKLKGLNGHFRRQTRIVRERTEVEEGS